MEATHSLPHATGKYFDLPQQQQRVGNIVAYFYVLDPPTGSVG